MHRTEKRPQRLRAIRVPKGVSEPRGSRERLTAAVRRLAPHKGVWIKDDGSKQILSEELAIELLDSLARRYNTNTYLTAHAERYSSIDRRLKKLATHAAVLANDLSDLGELTATVIFNEALRSCRSKARSKIIERA